MARSKKGCGSCKMCGCEECNCKQRPKMLMALLVGLSVLVLTPSTEGEVSKNVMSSVFMPEVEVEVEATTPLADYMLKVVSEVKK
jgi:hypothetical protein